MKTIIKSLLALVCVLSFSAAAFAQTTSFTYQGRLTDNAAPANGTYELQFTLKDAASAGATMGSVLTAAPVAVSNGVFTVTLDFGGGVFTGASRWLEIGVRTNASVSAYTVLAPRQAITSAPYAVQALNAATAASVAAANLTGAISLAQLPVSVLTNNSTGVSLNGAFIGNGAGLTQLLGSSSVGGTGLRLESDGSGQGAPNIIGGSPGNFVAAGIVGATIGGGGATNLTSDTNSVAAKFATIGGGVGNVIQLGAFYSTISGGHYHTIESNAFYSIIGGGEGNRIQTNAGFSTIGGGLLNTIQPTADSSAIGGGANNTIQTNAHHSMIGGGGNNTIKPNANYSFIGGGRQNIIQTNVDHSTIGGGDGNTISDNNSYATIAGGISNTIHTGASESSIAGGSANSIEILASQASIGGGIGNEIKSSSYFSSIGGGFQNTIESSSESSIIGGGYSNSANGTYTAIVGGRLNKIISARLSFIGGGETNAIYADAIRSTIGGGRGNVIQTNSYASFIGGGEFNKIQTNAPWSTIGGGNGNYILTNAGISTIGGGEGNSIQTNAIDATIGGGGFNTITGSYGTIPGGDQNVAGTNGFAAGHRAKATHKGTFVWGDSTDVDVSSSANDQFTARASGGVRFYSNAGLTAGVTLAPGGAGWGSVSDRNAKKNFQPLDTQEVLAKLTQMPIQHWNYKWEQDSDVPHIGPVAQDFKAAFYPGRDDKSITTLEFDGVALAAIQGLNQKVETRIQKSEDSMQKLRAENTELKQRLADLEKLVQSLAQAKGGE